jgi:hypothetical protein
MTLTTAAQIQSSKFIVARKGFDVTEKREIWQRINATREMLVRTEKPEITFRFGCRLSH